MGVIETLGLVARNPSAGESLQRTDRILIFLGDKADRFSNSLGSASTADAVDVILVMGREVVVHDVGDAIHIDAPRGNVCGDQHPDLSVTELLKRTQPLVL